MDQSQNDTQRLEIYRIWRVMVANSFLIVSLTIASTLVALALTYVLPEVYESSALVLVRPLEEISLGPGRGQGKEILDFPVSQASPFDAPSKTYIEVIKSRAVAEKIVSALRLDISGPIEEKGFFGRLKDDLKKWLKNTIRNVRHYFKYGRVIPANSYELAVEDIVEKLTLATKKNTYAFEISYRSGSPKETADVANSAAEIFLEHSDEAYRSESNSMRVFLEKRMNEARLELESTRNALQEFKRENHTFSLNSEHVQSISVISDLESTLELTEMKLAGLRRTFSDGSPKIRATQAEKNQLEESLKIRYALLGDHPAKERALNELELAVGSAEARFELIQKNFEEARIKEYGQLNEIRIVSRAVEPLYPIKPIKYIYAGIGFALALVTGMLIALLVEYLNPLVRTVNDITVELELPLLGAIPPMGTPSKIRWPWLKR